MRKLKVMVFLTVFFTIFNCLHIEGNASKTLFMASVDEVGLVINGEKQELKNPILLINNKTYLPIREMSELLNLYVVYDNENSIIKISNIGIINSAETSKYVYVRNTNTTVLSSDIMVKINGYMYDIKSPVVLLENVSYLPFREIAEMFGFTVDWHQENKTVEVNTAVEIDSQPIDLIPFFVENGDNYIWGYMNSVGKTIIEPQFDSAGCFSEGLAWVGEYIDKDVPHYGYEGDIKYGYINENGKLIIPYQYDAAYDFKDGKAEVLKREYIENEYDHGWNYSYYYIDKIGNYIKDFGISDISRSDEFSISNQKWNTELRTYYNKDNQKWGVADKNGNIILDCKYDKISEYNDGLFVVKYLNDWGYVDINDNIIIPPQFERATAFVGGIAVVNDKSENGKNVSMIINKYGNMTEIERYINDWCTVLPGGIIRTFGNVYFDKNGRIITPKL